MPRRRRPPISRRIGPGATYEETATPTPERHAAHARLGPATGHAESEDRRVAPLMASWPRRRLSVPAARGLPATSRAPRRRELVWSHDIGKPTERVQLSADVTMNQKLEEDRELFSQLEHRGNGGNRGGKRGARRQGADDGTAARAAGGSDIAWYSMENRESTTGESLKNCGTGDVDDA